MISCGRRSRKTFWASAFPLTTEATWNSSPRWSANCIGAARATLVFSAAGAAAPKARKPATGCLVAGITGPGGAGKSTLIDELALRFLSRRPGGRLAILSHDPSARGQGALLGDRATMVYAQDDRIFMRSLAT